MIGRVAVRLVVSQRTSLALAQTATRSAHFGKYAALGRTPVNAFGLLETKDSILQGQNNEHMLIWTRGKKKKAEKNEKVSAANEGMAQELDLTKPKEKIQRVVDAFKQELSKLRTGRPDPSILDQVKVNAYDKQTSLPNVAQVSLKSPKLLTVSVFDAALVEAVRSAIQQANLNLNPSVEGTTVSVPIPKLTKESRNEVAKKAKEAREKTRTNISTIRRDVMKDLNDMKKKKTISEDDYFAKQKEVDKMFDDFQNTTTKMFEEKEKEILAG